MNNILISSAGRRVSLLNSFRTELRLVHPEAKVIASDLNPTYSAACSIADDSFQVPSILDVDFISVLIEKSIKYGIKLIIPTLDTELLIFANNKDLFEQNGIEIVISNSNFIEICRDKRKSNSFFESINIPVPRNINPFNPTFPLFIKPFNGSLSNGILKIDKVEDFTETIRNNPKSMFMEYISPDFYDEYTVDMYFDINHNLKCLVPRQRLEIRGGEISKGITKKSVFYETLKNLFSNIKGAKGCITAQFFVNKKNELDFYGIEINPRFGGGYPLSYSAGALYPKFIIEEYLLKKRIQFFDNWQDQLLMLRYDAEIIKGNE